MDYSPFLETLGKQGVFVVPWKNLDCIPMRKWLMDRPVYDAHVKVYAKREGSFLEATSQRWPMFCHTMADAICAPGWFEQALAWLPFADAYFGEPAVLYSVNAFWTQPSPFNYDMTHSWHRDEDDRKQLVLFMLGADTAPEAAHLYQRGSHKIGDAMLGYNKNNPPPHVIHPIFGPQGTSFLVDTRGLHMGLRPNRMRLLMWARYGVSECPASYKWDKLEPVPRKLLGSRFPADPVTQNAIKLVAA